MVPEPESGTLPAMRQAQLILITGLPGTGKSTLARALASRYQLPILTKDTIKEPLLDTIGARDRAQSRSLSDASFAVLFALARDCLSTGTDLVIEGNFRPGEHEPALQYPQSVRIIQVLCRATESVRIARLKARATDRNRHPGHRDADLATAGSPQVSLDFLDLPGERLVFDSDAQSPAEVDVSRLRTLLDSLDHWRRGRTPGADS